MGTDIMEFDMGGIEVSFRLWLIKLVVVYTRMTDDECVDTDIKRCMFGGIFG